MTVNTIHHKAVLFSKAGLAFDVGNSRFFE
jgi:hypothetical protein